ncbi:hypothetical protein [Bacillus pseudomycoides]|uniref:hypothetical protein n=1 Tax=Bacillus pseudomycoides TaxID=64104 RepID=UPI000BEBF035|nr:hypothetical protein [Bacillus pseudomycoides]PEB42268.1 hypothetical protein COO06_08130 [Bacillus pseudomycoides]
MNIELFCFNKGLDYLKKELIKLRKKCNRESEKLFVMTDENSTMKRRSSQRIRLATICEEIQQKESYLQEIEKKIENIRINKKQKLGIGVSNLN